MSRDNILVELNSDEEDEDVFMGFSSSAKTYAADSYDPASDASLNVGDLGIKVCCPRSYLLLVASKIARVCREPTYLSRMYSPVQRQSC